MPAFDKRFRFRLIALVGLASLGAGCEGDGGDDIASPQYDCSVYPSAAFSPYVLPWRVGETHQANPHIARESSVQRYAIDLPMPIATDVVAARAGTVVRVEERYFDGDNTPGHENFVMVEHDDKTVARYFHLTNAGAFVGVGDPVRLGDVIGISGNTGNSSGPHLHFDVTRSCCAVPPMPNEMPFGETLPLTFRNAGAGNAAPNATDQSCGLRFGVLYTAFPY